MGRKKCIVKLREYARRTGAELTFEEIPASPRPVKRFLFRAVINGQHFPIGLGENRREAKQNAAKTALRSLSEKENQGPETITKLNRSFKRLCCDSGHKNRVPINSIETPRLKSRNATPFVLGDEENPAASGKTKKEAKEEAVKLACHEIYGIDSTEFMFQVSCLALCENGGPVRLSSPRTRLTFNDGKSECISTRSDSTAFRNSSHNLKDAVMSEEINTRDSFDEATLIQSEIFRNKSEFDSIKSLSKGAFGHVFKARDILLDKFFAIKIVPCKESGEALREVKALSELEHCNIVRFYSAWIDDTGCPWDSTDDNCSTSLSGSSSGTMFLYIQMDLCDTKTLKVWIDEKNAQGVKNSLPISKRQEESLDFVQQIVCGVEYIHSKMFIHRDLKPSNILFKGNAVLKIGDFGLVTTEKDLDDERTVNKGTPTYMAPEQESQKTYDRKVDIFAVGLIYFELLWKFTTGHERAKIWSDVRRQIFPKEFSHFYSEHKIIRSMLSMKPDDRPEARTLRSSLEECKHTLNTEETKRRLRRTV